MWVFPGTRDNRGHHGPFLNDSAIPHGVQQHANSRCVTGWSLRDGGCLTTALDRRFYLYTYPDGRQYVFPLSRRLVSDEPTRSAKLGSYLGSTCLRYEGNSSGKHASTISRTYSLSASTYRSAAGGPSIQVTVSVLVALLSHPVNHNAEAYKPSSARTTHTFLTAHPPSLAPQGRLSVSVIARRPQPPLIDSSWFLGTHILGHVPVGNLVDKER